MGEVSKGPTTPEPRDDDGLEPEQQIDEITAAVENLAQIELIAGALKERLKKITTKVMNDASTTVEKLRGIIGDVGRL